MEIHPTAVVHPRARLPEQGGLGPFCVIEEGVEIGEGTRLDAHVVLHRGVRLGRACHVHTGVVLGHTSMVRGETTRESFLEIGDRTIILPNTTVERGHGEGTSTRISADGFIMTEVHVEIGRAHV